MLADNIPQPISVDEVISFPLPEVETATLNCDATKVAYCVDGKLHLLECASNQDIHSTTGHSPKWSPSSPGLLAYRKQGGQGIELLTPQRTQTTVAGGLPEIQAFWWSPEGHRMAVLHSQQEPTETSPPSTSKPTSIVCIYPELSEEMNVVSIVDIESDTIVFTLPSPPGEYFLNLAWHPDGKLITIIQGIENLPGWDYKNRIIDVELETGRVTERIPACRNEIECPTWSPSGETLALCYSPHALWSTGRTVAAVMQREERDIRILNKDLFVRRVEWTPDGNHLMCTGLSGIEQHIYLMHSSDGSFVKLSTATGRHTCMGLS